MSSPYVYKALPLLMLIKISHIYCWKSSQWCVKGKNKKKENFLQRGVLTSVPPRSETIFHLLPTPCHPQTSHFYISIANKKKKIPHVTLRYCEPICHADCTPGMCPWHSRSVPVFPLEDLDKYRLCFEVFWVFFFLFWEELLVNSRWSDAPVNQLTLTET